jgi:hypothetical protein
MSGHKISLVTASMGPPEIVETLLATYAVYSTNPSAIIIDNGTSIWPHSVLAMGLSIYPWAKVVAMPSNIGHGAGIDCALRMLDEDIDIALVCDSDVAFAKHLVEAWEWPDKVSRILRPKNTVMAAILQDYSGYSGILHSMEFPGVVPIPRPDPSFLLLHMERYRECGMPSFAPELSGGKHWDVGSRCALSCIDAGYGCAPLDNLPVIHFRHLSVMSLCERGMMDRDALPYVEQGEKNMRRFKRFRQELRRKGIVQ